MLASFLWNLARHNRLPDKALTQLAAESGSAPRVVVTALTGLPAAALTAALPELRQPAPPKSAERRRHRHLGFDGVTVACAWCCAHRGDRHATRVWSHNHDTVCRRHRRWLDSPIMHSHGHLDLNRHPEILAAHRHHHQLVHCHGTRGNDAYATAIAVIER